MQFIRQFELMAEEKYKGLVIANEGPQFSAGANVALIFMLAAEQEFEELDIEIRNFQNTMMTYCITKPH